MSIPDRLWRVVKGHWTMANDQFKTIEDRLAEADAYRELTDALKALQPAPEQTSAVGQSPTAARSTQPGSSSGPDPLHACYELLGVVPGTDLQALELAHAARIREIPLESASPGSPEHAAMEARRGAVEAAYEKLRDVLNPTETRFEKLEF